MEALSFTRHEDNPLDSLGIGRVVERKKEVFLNLVNNSIIRVQKVLTDYGGRYQGWDRTFDAKSYIEDPFDGFRIKFTASSFPFPSIEKIYMGNLQYTIESGICRLILQIDHDETINKFGTFEEAEENLKYWLQKLPGRNNDDRYKIKWI